MKAGENPFAPGRLERMLGFDPVLAGTTWETLEEKWRALGCRAAVTGHRGSGKSALLRAWAKRCDSPVVLRFNQQRRRLSEADHRELAEGKGWLWLTSTPAVAAILLERAATPLAERFRPDLEQRFRRCRGNLRELLLECYDDLADRKLL